MSDGTAQVEITTPGGRPLPSVVKNQPFVIVVRVPPNASHPATINVTVSTAHGTREVTLAANGVHQYRSNPLTLEDGGPGAGSWTVGPFEFSHAGTSAGSPSTTARR